MKVELDADLEGLTERIIGAAFTVANGLGHGFLEMVYKNALSEELAAQGLVAEKERAFPVLYCYKRVGLYVADLVVDGRVIVELKAVESLTAAHVAQVLNYLKASGLTVGLLLNFGSARVQVRRVLS